MIGKIRAELQKLGWRVETITGHGPEGIYAYPFANRDYCLALSQEPDGRIPMCFLEHLNSETFKCWGETIGDFSTADQAVQGAVDAARRYFAQDEESQRQNLESIRAFCASDNEAERIWRQTNEHLVWN